MPDKLSDTMFGPDYCLLCWAYDGNLCGRCLAAMLSKTKEPKA